MKTHIVAQGESLTEIAVRHGFASGRELYEHPANEEFRRKRSDPNLIFPGDRIAIPERGQKSVGAGSENRHRFKKRRPKKHLRLELRDPEEDRFANRSYELRLERAGSQGDEPIILGGTLDSEARMVEQIPADVRKGTLWVRLDGESVELDLLVDHLDPAEEITGIQARLKNLGFDCGPVDGVLGPKTKGALRLFQQDSDLPVTEEPDERTREALRTEHGC